MRRQRVAQVKINRLLSFGKKNVTVEVPVIRPRPEAQRSIIELLLRYPRNPVDKGVHSIWARLKERLVFRFVVVEWRLIEHRRRIAAPSFEITSKV
jgi:hypothetical protein